MYSVRRWSVRHARGMEIFYNLFEKVFVSLHPFWNFIGYSRLEKPMALVEKNVKGFLFDCKMCGQCILSSTGMSCPMNCPKSLRNGPCGGVFQDGGCEVKPEMRCVWLEAYDGNKKMSNGVKNMDPIQPPVDHRLQGRSAWLKMAQDRVREKNARNNM